MRVIERAEGDNRNEIWWGFFPIQRPDELIND